MHVIHYTHAGKSSSFLLKDGQRWLLGRGPDCQISIPDPHLSAEHCELSQEDGKLGIRLTKGKSLIEFDHNLVKEATLCEGARFEIGDTTFFVSSLKDGMDLLDAKALLSAESSLNLPATRTALEKEETTPLEPKRSSRDLSPGKLIAQLVYLFRNATDRGSLGKVVLELACGRIRAVRGLIAQMDGADKLEIVASNGFKEVEAIASVVSKSILREIIDRRCSIVISDTSTSNLPVASKPSMRENGIRAVACAPVFNSDGDLWGLIYVDHPDHAVKFSIQDAELLIWLGQVYTLLDENIEMAKQLESELSRLKKAAVRDEHIVAESPCMVKLLGMVEKAATSEANILLVGESGTGKERIARLLHARSPRKSKRIVTRNCAAIPEHLFESEMFGHKKGAFTGATNDRKGAFLEADGGTLFLDEIGDLDYTLQTKLLRVIQEGRMNPVGSDMEVAVDVRLICATNRSLAELTSEKKFREDLYYRISTVTMEIPPLRERPEDIPALAQYFVSTLSESKRHIGSEAMEKLKRYAWPGNVRELLSTLEQAVIFSAGDEIGTEDINLRMEPSQSINLQSTSLVEAERSHILNIMERASGNKTEAAKLLGIARSTLVLKLKSYEQQNR